MNRITLRDRRCDPGAVRIGRGECGSTVVRRHPLHRGGASGADGNDLRADRTRVDTGAGGRIRSRKRTRPLPDEPTAGQSLLRVHSGGRRRGESRVAGDVHRSPADRGRRDRSDKDFSPVSRGYVPEGFPRWPIGSDGCVRCRATYLSGYSDLDRYATRRHRTVIDDSRRKWRYCRLEFPRRRDRSSRVPDDTNDGGADSGSPPDASGRRGRRDERLG